DAVESEADALVLPRLFRLIGLDPCIALAIAVGVDDQRRPALRLARVARLPEQFRVDPADEGELVLQIVAEPQRVVRILPEVQVVGSEASVDEGELLRLRVIDSDLTRVLHEPVRRAREREHLRRGMTRGRRAVRWWILR